MDRQLTTYLAVGGFALLAVGLTLYGIRFEDSTLTIVLTAAGAISLLICAALNARGLANWTRSRAARHGTNAVLMTVFFVAILVVVQAISVRNSHRYDFTSNSRYTLSPQTTQLLAGLDSDIELTAFYRGASAQRLPAKDLLQMYQYASERVRFEFVDPDRKPHRARELGAGYDDVVVQAGERRRVVNILNEENLTNAILEVTRKQFKAVYFTVGHNERQIDDTDRWGYASARDGLQNSGYTVRTLSLLDATRVPEDCEVLVVAGPRRDFLGGEINTLRSYLHAGGNALFLLDPREPTDSLEAVLREYRVVFDPAVLLDARETRDKSDRVFDATVTKVGIYEQHPITAGFNAITMFPYARPVRILDADPGDLRVTAQYLAWTSETAWGETDMNSFTTGRATRDGKDLAPPLPVAVAATRNKLSSADQAGASRIVVIGDSDFATNSFYGLLGNSDFFLNSVNYLAEDEGLISIRPKASLGDAIYITERQGRLVFAVSIVLLPLSVVAVGASVFWRRRRQG